MDNKKDKSNSPIMDLERLTQAYAQSLERVSFGSKEVPSRRTSKPQTAQTEEKIFVPKDYVPLSEESSAELDSVVRKIRQRHKALSHSVWTDNPVLKPKKSVWLDDSQHSLDEKPLEKPKRQANQSAQENSRENTRENSHEKPLENQKSGDLPKAASRTEETVIPVIAQMNGVAHKREIVMSIDDNGSTSVRELPPPPARRQLTMTVPKGYYDELEKKKQRELAGATSAVKRTVYLEMPISKAVQQSETAEQAAVLNAKSQERVRAAAAAIARALAAESRAENSPREEIISDKSEDYGSDEGISTLPESTEQSKSASTDVAVDFEKSEDYSSDESISTLPESVEQSRSASTDVAVDFEKSEDYSSDESISTLPESTEQSRSASTDVAVDFDEAEDYGSDESISTLPEDVEQSKSESTDVGEPVTYEQMLLQIEERKKQRRLKRQNYNELEFNFINSLVCVGAILAIFAAMLIMDRESGFMESENRNYAEFPAFSISSLLSGEYTDKVTEYFTDTVAGRESLKKFCANFTAALGVSLNDTVISGTHKTAQREQLDRDKIATTTTVTANTGVILTEDSQSTDTSDFDEEVTPLPENLDDGQWEGDVIVYGTGENVRAVGAYYGSFEVGLEYADTINKWKAALPEVNVYNMCIPTACAYYMPSNLKDSFSDQKDNIDNIASGLEGIINVDVFDTIGEHTDEYIYSRTDHHWQPLGAYYAASVFADKAGVEYPELDTYEQCSIEGFVGTMYAYSDYNQELADNPDTFIYYKPDNSYTTTYYDTDFTNGVSGDLFFDYASGVNCYSAILNVDNEIAKIETDCTNGRVLVIFKDSFGNALVPFLTHGFSEIYVCDFRYFDINAIDFCREVGCTDLLFAVSITSASTPSHISAINNLRIQSSAQADSQAE